MPSQEALTPRYPNRFADVPPAGLWIRGIGVRLFLTCWIVFTLHFASNTVREVYLALAIGDHLSFRVDEYRGMHPDLFEKPGYGWHIGANPGVSMLAAIPYALARTVIDPVVAAVNRKRAESGLTEPPGYSSPWPMARAFYTEAWRRGYDIKFGLAAFVMQSLCMAPSSALGVVMVFFLLRQLFGSERTALWLALLYAFGTAVFFRTGYLNHNLMLGHFAFFGFLCLWNPGDLLRWSAKTRIFLAGIAGGIALLFDYSGIVFLLGLFAYAFHQSWVTSGLRAGTKSGSWYVAGALGPILLLWFYQWQSFGHPFLPGQHWMPPVEWIEKGYQGFSMPQLELFTSLGFDYRFGLFTSCPIFLLAFLSPWVNRGKSRRIPRPEMVFLIAVALGLWIFCSGINYARLQFNTGIRYLTPTFPFLFVLASLVLVRLPRMALYFAVVAAVTESWCLAMYRDVERGLGLADPVLHVFADGFQLPAMTVLSRMAGQYGDYFAHGASPLPLFVLAAAILFGIWRWNIDSPPLDSSRRELL